MPPGVYVGEPSSFVIWRSMKGGVTSVAELFAGIASTSPAGTLTAAVLEIFPVPTVEATFAVTL